MEFVAALDVGSTNLKCQIFSSKFDLVGSSIQKVKVVTPHNGWEEIDPEELMSSIEYVIQEALYDAGIESNMVKVLGLSTQRNTFITWNKFSGRCYHKFITWKDSRSSVIIENLNKSFFLKIVRYISKVLGFICPSKQLKLAKSFFFTNAQILPKLIWLLENNNDFKEDLSRNEVQFGTLDTWLLYRASKGELHVTGFSCASSTGLFNIFNMAWLPKIILQYFGLNSNMLPEICDPSISKYKCYNVKISNIPVQISIADQSASLFGTGSFLKNTAKVTMGTGMFLDINCGQLPKVSSGFYPLVGWQFDDEMCYTIEAVDQNCGSLISLGKSIGFYKNLIELNELSSISNIPSVNNVLFVLPDSKFSMYQEDNYTFIGLTSITTKVEMTKSILDSFAFRIKKQLDKLQKEIPEMKPKILWVDGGVSRNNYICQTLADITSTIVIRMKNSYKTEITCLGVAFMAGLSSGVWFNKDDLKNFRMSTDEKFVPQNENYSEYERKYIKWLNSQQCLY